MSALFVAPHPDDETLGCGGTMLRTRAAGTAVHWLIATTMEGAGSYSEHQVTMRQTTIEAVANAYGAASTTQLAFPTATLDTPPRSELVQAFATVLSEVGPTDVYLPYPDDAHSDHRVVYECMTAALKWFRVPSVQRIFCYETPSETEAGLSAKGRGFTPNWFVNIASHLDGKLRILSMYDSEIGEFPFPRSAEYVSALAKVRGGTVGYEAAEAFMLIRGRMP
jgi:LmbE family N-acetylglucosaminyl deacetylase